MTEPLPVSFDDVRAAADRLAGVARRTPVLTSSVWDERTGARVFFKPEPLQRTGSFKFRGAFNALSQLTSEQRTRGVVTWSSGNHAQAIGRAGRLLGIPAIIVMPDDAPRVKYHATIATGARVVTYDRTRESREEIGNRLAAETGGVIIPPYDHAQIIAGQGTAALELLEDTGPLDALFVCVGGGGLISGCALAASGLAPGCRVIGVEPEGADDATRSFHSGTLQRCDSPQTIADGARTPSLGTLTFPIVRALVHDMTTVSDKQLLETMFALWDALKVVVEPTGALAAAGLDRHAADWRGKRIGVILSGGNVDIAAVPNLRAMAGFSAG